jgi:hypothetical protein
LYQQPNPAPGEVVGRIVAALDEVARGRLHDAAAVRCLDTVLQGSAALAQPGAALPPVAASSRIPALDLATALRAQALESIAGAGVSSVTGALALDAIPFTVVDSLSSGSDWSDFPASTVISRYARFAREGDLSVLAGEYCGHGLERAFRYFVARDVSDFVGVTGPAGKPGLPTLQESARLADTVGKLCRQQGAAPRLRRYEQDLQGIMTLARDDRVRALEPLMQESVESSLDALGRAGARGG